MLRMEDIAAVRKWFNYCEGYFICSCAKYYTFLKAKWIRLRMKSRNNT